MIERGCTAAQTVGRCYLRGTISIGGSATVAQDCQARRAPVSASRYQMPSGIVVFPETDSEPRICVPHSG